MPLYANDKSRIRKADRLDLSVRRHGLDPKPRCRTIDTLRMQRIDHHLGDSGKRYQEPALGQHDAVRRSIWAIGSVLPRPVIEAARNLMHSLVERSAKRYIQFLDAATDSQDRQVAPDRLANKRQRRRVALRVVQDFRVTGLGAVMARMDVRRTPGQEQSVQPVEHLADVDFRSDRRDQYRQALRGIDHGTRIPLVDSVEDALFDRATAGGNTYERQMTGGNQIETQGWSWRRPVANGSRYTNNSGSNATPNCTSEIETVVILRC